MCAFLDLAVAQLLKEISTVGGELCREVHKHSGTQQPLANMTSRRTWQHKTKYLQSLQVQAPWFVRIVGRKCSPGLHSHRLGLEMLLPFLARLNIEQYMKVRAVLAMVWKLNGVLPSTLLSGARAPSPCLLQCLLEASNLNS